MRNYSKINPQFWMGKTGKSLRQEGASAQVVALYLITSPHANLLGLYYLPLSYVVHDTGLSLDEVQCGMQGCIASGLCRYDEASDMVWVVEMARFQVAETLSPRDKRISSVQEAYKQLPANPFLPSFYERYGEALQMTFARSSDGHRIPIEKVSQGLRSQEQEQEQEQEQGKEQEREQEGEQCAMREGFTPTPSLSVSPSPDFVKANGASSGQRSALKTPLPENFAISASVRLWAAKQQVTHLDLHLERFISKVKRNGYTYVDWDEAFKVAILNDWAGLSKTSLASETTTAVTNESTSKLGKAGRATANNAQRWLEEADASC